MRAMVFAVLGLLAGCGPQPRDLPIGTYRAPPDAVAMHGEVVAQELARQTATLLIWDTGCGSGETQVHREIAYDAARWFGAAWRPAMQLVADAAARDLPPDRVEFCGAVLQLRGEVRVNLAARARTMGTMPSTSSITSVRGMGTALGVIPQCRGAKPMEEAYVYAARREAMRQGLGQPALFNGIMLAKVAQFGAISVPELCVNALELMRTVIKNFPMPAPRPAPQAPAKAAPPPAPAKPQPKPVPDGFDI